MKMPKPDPKTKARFDDIAEELVSHGVTTATMMGMPALKAGGKLFAGVWGSAMNFKLGGEARAATLKLKGVEPFDPSGMGRPMKEWIVVPPAHAKRWKELAEAGRAYVAG